MSKIYSLRRKHYTENRNSNVWSTSNSKIMISAFYDFNTKRI